jgi:hypothetical protein
LSIELRDSSVLARRDVVWREVSGELVIVDPEGKKILGLNGTGGNVWNMLDGARTLGDIAAELSETHAVESEQVLRDVLAFARVLVERSLADAR